MKRMCGIAGIVTSSPEGLDATIQLMNDRLVHRGPDDAGKLVLPDEGVALAMRRLSIVDLQGGRQPMWDERKMHAVVFNGEIYNARALREELHALGHDFASDHSDTEVLVHGYEQWGESLVPRLNGMFAFAIWDRANRQLFVARDRMGEKPLYIAEIDHGFVVASELKAILAHPGVARELDPIALEQLLAFDYILGPRTILARVLKLPAAHFAVITSERIDVRPYWRMEFHNDEAMALDDVIGGLDNALNAAVRTRMVADVPVGLFLSGGLDSTTVGYYMCKHSSNVHSFSIGFDDPAFDESRYAQMAATHLGTQHHREIFSSDKVLDLVARVTEILDEPMADQSILPTLLLSQFARGWVKVALGGDGSDELLMGYRAYKGLKAAWMLDPVPTRVRSVLSRLAGRIPSEFGSAKLRGKNFFERLERPPELRQLCALGSFQGAARWIMSPDMQIKLGPSVFDTLDPLFLGQAPAGSDAAARTIAAYAKGYLQEDILVKVDRASMAVSLEVRAPFLDPELVDFLSSVPPRWKMQRFTGKFALRQLMRGRIPDALIDRPKRGFGAPIDSWLRGPLSPLVNDYLSSSRLARGGTFDPHAVQAIVASQRAGSRTAGQRLWPLLLFELWTERWLGSDHTAAACTTQPTVGARSA
jgi:asparagine synthase (glutamine-hydrolysing)